ncbi:MAG: NADH-quinone oxidoreductase subunit C [Candidatus Omnitrophica bacterium]|nr:NADH-quinone oxidoreductase subunit C [Candidatus Omnitrophota bacterium]
MTAAEIKSKIEAALPGVKITLSRESILVENPQDLPKVMRFLKESPDFRLDYLSSVTGVDYLEYLESVYHLYSMEKQSGTVVVKIRVKRENPKIPSVVPIFRGAEFQERENYDMYGIVYENHPDLRRLFMWEGFEGYPMRKDYQQEDSETLEAEDVQWLEKNGVPVPAEMKQKAEELKKQGKRAVAQKPGQAEPE